MLADSYGRVATDLRVSLTDRCNLRCSYCMPPEGLDWLPSADQLSDDELATLVSAAIAETGASGLSGLGQVMKTVTPRVAGRADGARVAAEVRRRLSG